MAHIGVSTISLNRNLLQPARNAKIQAALEGLPDLFTWYCADKNLTPAEQQILAERLFAPLAPKEVIIVKEVSHAKEEFYKKCLLDRFSGFSSEQRERHMKVISFLEDSETQEVLIPLMQDHTSPLRTSLSNVVDAVESELHIPLSSSRLRNWEMKKVDEHGRENPSGIDILLNRERSKGEHNEFYMYEYNWILMLTYGLEHEAFIAEDMRKFKEEIYQGPPALQNKANQ